MKIKISYEKCFSNYIYIKQYDDYDVWLIKLYHRKFDKEIYHNVWECHH